MKARDSMTPGMSVSLGFVLQGHMIRIFYSHQGPENADDVNDPSAYFGRFAIARGGGDIFHVKIVEAVGALLDGGERVLADAHGVAYVHAEAHARVTVFDQAQDIKG